MRRNISEYILRLVFLFFIFWAIPSFAQVLVDTAWVRRYNGLGNGNDWGVALGLDGKGNLYVSGESEGAGTSSDYVTIKYNPSGDTLWVRRYNGPANSVDKAYALAVDVSGNVYVTGESEDKETKSDYATIKYDPSGEVLWTKRYDGGGKGLDKAYALTLDQRGNVYATGESEGKGTGPDYVTIKYNGDGDTLWIRRYAGSGNSVDKAYALAVDSSGNVYVTGQSGSGAGADYATIKYDASGDQLWVKRYNGVGNAMDKAYALGLDAKENVYVTGFSFGNGTDKDYVTIKYNPRGDTLWVKRYNGPGNGLDWARALKLDATGNLYVTGQSYNKGSGSDYATIKYNRNGDTLWVRRYEGPGNHNSWDLAHALALDDSGNVYVTGESQGRGSDLDYATVKYDSAGNLLWVQRYNGPANSIDNAFAIAVDDSGNVYVTGFSYGKGIGSDCVTIKYKQTGR